VQGADVEVSGDECAIDLLLASQEGCASDADDMDRCARFNEARAQVSYVGRIADNQNC
jgi:hypothetical protein